MASNKVLVSKSYLSNIGDAIREKTETSGTLLLSEMPAKIRSIETGSNPVIRSLSISSNGTYNAPVGVDGYNPITVNVPNNINVELGDMDEISVDLEQGDIVGGKRNSPASIAYYHLFTTLKSKLTFLPVLTRTNIELFKTLYTPNGYTAPSLEDKTIEIKTQGDIDLDCSSNELLKFPKIICNQRQNIHLSLSNLGIVELNDFLKLGPRAYLDSNYRNLFYCCFNLRSIDPGFIQTMYDSSHEAYIEGSYNMAFYHCISLRKLDNIPVIYNPSLSFNSWLDMCEMLNHITFAPTDSAPWYNTLMQISRPGHTMANYGANLPEYDNELHWMELNTLDDIDNFINDETAINKLCNKMDINLPALLDFLNSLPDCSEAVAEKGLPNRVSYWYPEIFDGFEEVQIAVANATNKGFTIISGGYNTFLSYKTISELAKDYWISKGYHYLG